MILVIDYAMAPILSMNCRELQLCSDLASPIYNYGLVYDGGNSKPTEAGENYMKTAFTIVVTTNHSTVECETSITATLPSSRQQNPNRSVVIIKRSNIIQVS